MAAEPVAAPAAPGLHVVLEPARQGARITVDVPAGATRLNVWRVAGQTGDVAYVRGYVDHPVTGPSTVLLFDWEIPLGVDVVYSATITVAGVASTPATVAFRVDDDRDWLTDLARPTNSFPILVESLPELQYDGPVGVHRVLDRRDPVLTTGALWTPTGTLSFFTSDELERDRARAALGAGIPFLLRTPPTEGVGNIYLGTTGLREQRPSRIAYHWDRRFAVDVVQVARPDPSIFVPLAPLTYADLKATWATYADLKATGKSYQEIAYTFPADRVDPAPPWLPDDV